MNTPEPEWLTSARRAELEREVATWQGARRRRKKAKARRRQLTAAEQAVRRYQEAVADL